MNAQEFYEYFKDALDYLGPGFRGMDEVIVCVQDNKFILMGGDKEASINLPERKAK
jgi:hypothetical protein